MVEIIYYSASQNCFVCESLRSRYEESADGWPEDAKEISERWYSYLLSKQSEGRTIVPNEYGMPVLAPVVINWQDNAEEQRQLLLKEAYAAAADWRTELDLGIIDKEDKASLKIVMAYISKLKKLKLKDINEESDYTAIVWPTPPDLDGLFPLALELAGEDEEGADEEATSDGEQESQTETDN